MKTNAILHRIIVGLVILSLPAVSIAGHLIGRGGSVGGISIDVAGVVGPANKDMLKQYLTQLRKEFQKPSEQLSMPVERRMVSLKQLEEACRSALKNELGQIPPEVRYLGGLQRIEYVLVYPETNDLVFVGPAEGWKIDDAGNVVGITTGRPVLQLDDLIVALRSSDRARQEAISCSINPTQQGSRQYMELWAAGNRNEAQLKAAFGPQQVTLSGISPDTHFARVLVAADYKMKRIAMELDKSPVMGLPSYVQLMSRGSVAKADNVNPRWWLTCDYDPLARSEDGLAWELRGRGVKAMTEDDFIDAQGKAQASGKASALAQKWADTFTEKYDALSVKDPIFGELRNIMDLAVIAALIQREHLLAKAGLEIPVLSSPNSDLRIEKWNAPKSVAPQISIIKSGRSAVVTASGGVEVPSWEIASRFEISSRVAEVRSQVAAPTDLQSFWWQ